MSNCEDRIFKPNSIHLYKCKECKQEFTLFNHNPLFCLDKACRRKHNSKIQLRYYHKKKGTPFPEAFA